MLVSYKTRVAAYSEWMPKTWNFKEMLVKTNLNQSGQERIAYFEYSQKFMLLLSKAKKEECKNSLPEA